MVFGVFSPGRTHCIAPKKLPDKAMSIWNLHKKFQLSSAMGLRDFDLQSQSTLMGGNPLIVVQCLVRVYGGCTAIKGEELGCRQGGGKKSPATIRAL